MIEITVAAFLIVLVSLAIVEGVSVSIQNIDVNRARVGGVFLSQEVAEADRAIARESWSLVDGLATGTANTFYPSISGGKWVTNSGVETINLNNATYTRSFYLDDTFRSTSTGDIVSSGGYYDPSGKKVNISVAWTDNSGKSSSYAQVEYLTRFLNNVYSQTDWSGGPAGEVTVTGATTTFATSTNLDTTSTVGSIQLPPQ